MIHAGLWSRPNLEIALALAHTIQRASRRRVEVANATQVQPTDATRA